MVNGGGEVHGRPERLRPITYEAMNSPFARGSAEVLADGVVAMLEGVRRAWRADEPRDCMTVYSEA